MIRMTFGVLPSVEDFYSQFKKVCESGRFSFRNDLYVGNDSLSTSELWDLVQTMVADYEETSSEEIGNWCSCVLQVLGFEWI